MRAASHSLLEAVDPPIVGIHLGHSATDRAFGTGVTQRLELVERDIGADLAVRPLDSLLDLAQERIGDSSTALRAIIGQLARIAASHPERDAVMRTTGQLAGRPERTRPVERFKNFHDLLARLHLLLLLDGHWSGDRPVE